MSKELKCSKRERWNANFIQTHKTSTSEVLLSGTTFDAIKTCTANSSTEFILSTLHLFRSKKVYFDLRKLLMMSTDILDDNLEKNRDYLGGTTTSLQLLLATGIVLALAESHTLYIERLPGFNDTIHGSEEEKSNSYSFIIITYALSPNWLIWRPMVEAVRQVAQPERYSHFR
uniref:Uncharacterized protein n=1 Tax=Glossina palpalis gambiensis TaxID=67801 RepID=A0A1B0BA26_9MUSC